MSYFKNGLLQNLWNKYLITDISLATDEMLRDCIVSALKQLYISQNWINSRKDNSKKVHYFSMEFMVGKQLKTNLVNLDRLDFVTEELAELGIDINKLFNTETESKTANGGLGRLAFAIMNGLANKDVNATGYTLLYNHGIFEQHIINGKQVETPDIWRNSSHGYEWYNVIPNKSKMCKFYGEVRSEYVNGKMKYVLTNYTPIKGVPYDLPVVGYKNNRINTLRFWESREMDNKTLKNLGLNSIFSSYETNSQYIQCAREISNVLYPDDSNYEGKLLRIKQEYFNSSMSLQTIIDEHLELHSNLNNFHKYNVLHINDTHCSWVVPEFMRLLIDEYDFEWNDAWNIVKNSVTYTNHTVLQEAMEKWDCNMVKMLLPRIFMIIEEINKRQSEDSSKAILKDGLIYTANMLVETAYSVNGVAEIHSNIIKEVTFKEFNEKYPNKFKNVTNGIEGRKWLLCDSIELSNLITQYIGSEWNYDFRKLKSFELYKDDLNAKQQVKEIKQQYKNELAQYI